MKWRVPVGVALLVWLVMPAPGYGWFPSLHSRSSRRAAPAAVYYCPVPVVAVATAIPYASVAPPIPYAVPPTALTPAPSRLYAEPRPAPPSSVEPRRAPDTMPKAGVGVQESRKSSENFYDNYFVAGATRTTGDRCAVTFWNLTGRSLELTVDGQARAVAAGQNVRLDLKRDFAWSVAGRDAERQQVPPRESGVEIVIRR